jgi:tetratricopeptide (TPR) repeat protein
MKFLFFVLSVCFFLNSIPSFSEEDLSELVNKGIKFHKKHNYQAAINEYTKAIAIDPSSSELYFNRGLSYSYSDQYELAVKDFNRAIELEPTNDAAIFNRGIAEFELGQYKEALKDFDKTIELVPGDAKAYFNRAITKNALEDKAGARADALKSKKLYKELNKRAELNEVSEFLRDLE